MRSEGFLKVCTYELTAKGLGGRPRRQLIPISIFEYICFTHAKRRWSSSCLCLNINKIRNVSAVQFKLPSVRVLPQRLVDIGMAFNWKLLTHSCNYI